MWMVGGVDLKSGRWPSVWKYNYSKRKEFSGLWRNPISSGNLKSNYLHIQWQGICNIAIAICIMHLGVFFVKRTFFVGLNFNSLRIINMKMYKNKWYYWLLELTYFPPEGMLYYNKFALYTLNQINYLYSFLAPSGAQEMPINVRSSGFRARNIHLSLSGQSQVSFRSVLLRLTVWA